MAPLQVSDDEDAMKMVSGVIIGLGRLGRIVALYYLLILFIP
jgi:hypothetical protein